ncbi:FAD/NAD(P)-binding oxidoreductase family protein [Tanacetum coccineum]
MIVENGHVVGVNVSDSSGSSQFNNEKLGFDAVVLAVGHSARDVYQTLLSHNVELVPKDFAVGLRVEHPQELINSIQYSRLANEVRSGRGKIPVADYKVVEYVEGEGNDTQFTSKRSCYSFCMCPGGQVVVTSIDPSELCINGMSFSRRASMATAATRHVTVAAIDFKLLFSRPLVWCEFRGNSNKEQLLWEAEILLCPCKPSKISWIVHCLLPGFISHNALLHGVETRTSSPVQIPRNPDTFESGSLGGLYPVGEGAGYAGGIVSAAVDGMYAGFALAKKLDLYKGDIESIFGRTQNCGSVKY